MVVPSDRVDMNKSEEAAFLRLVDKVGRNKVITTFDGGLFCEAIALEPLQSTNQTL